MKEFFLWLGVTCIWGFPILFPGFLPWAKVGAVSLLLGLLLLIFYK